VSKNFGSGALVDVAFELFFPNFAETSLSLCVHSISSIFRQHSRVSYWIEIGRMFGDSKVRMVRITLSEVWKQIEQGSNCKILKMLAPLERVEKQKSCLRPWHDGLAGNAAGTVDLNKVLAM
jgi:hypothetical protein